MSDRIVVEKLTVKEGESADGRPWKRYAAKDTAGEWYSTFDEGVARVLKEGETFDIDYETKKVGDRFVKNLMSAKPATNGNAAPEAYSHQTPSGEADWDKVALGKTRCALWMHFLAGQLAASLYLKGDTKPDYVIRIGTILVAAAERDIYERPPGDDGIPFESSN